LQRYLLSGDVQLERMTELRTELRCGHGWRLQGQLFSHLFVPHATHMEQVLWKPPPLVPSVPFQSQILIQTILFHCSYSCKSNLFEARNTCSQVEETLVHTLFNIKSKLFTMASRPAQPGSCHLQSHHLLVLWAFLRGPQCP
jgi:hypothetical protein